MQNALVGLNDLKWMKIAKLGGDKVGEGGYVRWRRMNMVKIHCVNLKQLIKYSYKELFNQFLQVKWLKNNPFTYLLIGWLGKADNKSLLLALELTRLTE